MKASFAVAVSLICLSWGAWSHGPAPKAKDPGVTVRQQDHMSTYVSITVAAPESPQVLAAMDAAFAEVARLSNLLSEWRPDSQISKVNQQAGLKPVAVDHELFQVARMAHQVSMDSEGAFDVTFNALGGLWDFKSSDPELPQTADIDRRVALVDYRQLLVDEKAKTLFLKRKGMLVGLGGIAKGYIVDRASAVLKSKGFGDHLVIAGGDLYASGRRGDRKWRIGIRHPRDRNIHATLELENEGVATSGNYEKFFMLEGVRYHHLLDPKTGRPARGVSSVTAVAKSAALADAYATALFVMGIDRGLALAGQRKDLEVYYFDDKYLAKVTQSLAPRIKVVPRRVP